MDAASENVATMPAIAASAHFGGPARRAGTGVPAIAFSYLACRLRSSSLGAIAQHIVNRIRERGCGKSLSKSVKP
jgi:hypothetical protein